MGDITANIKVYEQHTGTSKTSDSPYGYKEIMVECPATTDDADTFTITLADYGITSFAVPKGWVHTAHGVLVAEAPTTAVATGVLTVTVGGTTDNLVRTYLIGGY